MQSAFLLCNDWYVDIERSIIEPSAAGRGRESKPTGQSAGSSKTEAGHTLTKRQLQIVQSAAELFETKGYHQTVIDDIARAVGVQKGTIYHYFSSKSEILFWVHESFIQDVYDRQLQRSKLGGLTEREELAQIIQDVIDVIDSKRSNVRVFFEYYRELSDEDQQRIRAVRSSYTQLVKDVIIRGSESGAFQVNDVDMATLAFFGTVNWAYQWYRPEQRLGARQVADELWRYAIGGLTGLQDDDVDSSKKRQPGQTENKD